MGVDAARLKIEVIKDPGLVRCSRACCHFAEPGSLLGVFEF
jgi:hypothetical protein